MHVCVCGRCRAVKYENMQAFMCHGAGVEVRGQPCLSAFTFSSSSQASCYFSAVYVRLLGLQASAISWFCSHLLLGARLVDISFV